MAKTTKKASTKNQNKIKVKCLQTFRDKYTLKIYKKDTVLEMTEERLAEILKVGKLVERVAEPMEATAEA